MKILSLIKLLSILLIFILLVDYNINSYIVLGVYFLLHISLFLLLNERFMKIFFHKPLKGELLKKINILNIIFIILLELYYIILFSYRLTQLFPEGIVELEGMALIICIFCIIIFSVFIIIDIIILINLRKIYNHPIK